MENNRPILYTYFRSSSAARVRIALNHKKIDYDARPINLLLDEQMSEEYTAMNPGGTVPCMVIDGHTICQSTAILEYLEETRPQAPLLPRDPASRAAVRAIVDVICSGIQPLQNLSVLKTLPESERQSYACGIITKGLAVVERMLERTAGQFCVGDEVTLADCCLVPQLYNAYRYGVDIPAMPLICAIEARANELPAFRSAHWMQQPDCPDVLKQHSKQANH
ncbi:Glutathione S-transferase zeta-1 [Coemansia sp. RSA 2049]|nr:Glutathione S-transferase zeta-1 [Coemansia sp. RSA 2049]KAJ2513776.1 Glutathione S-transferase zeta-1 [Coemansia sp. RSA 1939]KAJ2608769.1 Glutathione S-transferase zeta-1 [Coemansia sp. RSA 1804]KAJ2668601.1 Glutathione S-transferase zeta-1 [Coemansia sp. RSA 1285]